MFKLSWVESENQKHYIYMIFLFMKILSWLPINYFETWACSSHMFQIGLYFFVELFIKHFEIYKTEPMINDD